MTLSIKQRAKINAALCLIHDNGHDANGITAAARNFIASGIDARTAYERALNAFADANPQLLPALSRVVGLIEASDDATTAQYDAALSTYIQTGDDSAARALAPMIARDMTALAARTGQEAPTFSPEFQEAAQSLPTQAIEHRTSTFQFTDPAPDHINGRSVVARTNDGSRIVRTASQISIGGSTTGMVAPKAQAAWADTPYVGPLSATPAPHGLNPNSAREAARAAAAIGSRAIISDGAGQDT